VSRIKGIDEAPISASSTPSFILTSLNLTISTMFSRITAVVAIALAIASPAMADHLFTITNNCAQTITPSLTNTGGPFIQLAAIGRGGTVTTSVPEGVRTWHLLS
jgi:hypothetical protein